MNGQGFDIGDTDLRFYKLSITKTVVYGMSFESCSSEITNNYEGMDPSGLSIYSTPLLLHGRPHNPIVNAGAIKTCSISYSRYPNES